MTPPPPPLLLSSRLLLFLLRYVVHHTQAHVLQITHAQIVLGLVILRLRHTGHSPLQTHSYSGSLTPRFTLIQTHSHSDSPTLRLSHNQTYSHSDSCTLRLTHSQTHSHSDSLTQTTHIQVCLSVSDLCESSQGGAAREGDTRPFAARLCDVSAGLLVSAPRAPLL